MAPSGEYTMRVAGIYATRWRNRLDLGAPDGSGFEGTRLAGFETAFRDQLPRLPRPIRGRVLPASDVIFTDPVPGVEITYADVFLFVLPSDQMVAAFTVDCRCTAVSVDPGQADALLDRFTEDAFSVQGKSLAELLTEIAPPGTEGFGARDAQATGRPVVPLAELTERHEIVYLADEVELSEQTIERLLYRRKPRYQREFTRRKELDELNGELRRGVVTTSASIIQGHQTLLQDSVFLSTVQAVGTLARFRQIWDTAYSSVRVFRLEKQRDDNGTQTRDDLEDLVDLLGNLEFDLTFSVEFPLMRSESFHSALSDVLDLGGQSDRLSQMFTQLGGSVQSEITAIDIRTNREREVRRSGNEIATQVLAAVGVPIGVLLAFFGINAGEVHPGASMFNPRFYWLPYLLAVALGLLPVLVLARARRRAARNQVAASDQRAALKAKLDHDRRIALATLWKEPVSG